MLFKFKIIWMRTGQVTWGCNDIGFSETVHFKWYQNFWNCWRIFLNQVEISFIAILLSLF